MFRFIFNFSLLFLVLFQTTGSPDRLKKNEWNLFSNKITISQIFLFFLIYGIWFLVFETF